MPHHLRFTRPASNLMRTEALYCQGLGLRVLGRFEDHDGFDGVMLGLDGADHHFEFTCRRQHPLLPTPGAEDLVVFYIADAAEWRERCARMLAAGFVPVTSFNPYWDRHGRCFADADGYRIVLQNAPWTTGAPAADSPPAVAVSYDELLSAFDWVNAGGGMFGNSAYVSRATGAVHWASDSMYTEDELPADIDDGTIYLALPHKNDLDLGKRLALRFADEALPESSHLVASYFHKRGAYARFKDLLERKGQLQAWHDYEARAVEAALRGWCREHGLQLKA